MTTTISIAMYQARVKEVLDLTDQCDRRQDVITAAKRYIALLRKDNALIEDCEAARLAFEGLLSALNPITQQEGGGAVRGDSSDARPQAPANVRENG